MNDIFCTRTARTLRKLGVAPRLAVFYSRFFYLSMVSVSGIIIIAGQRRTKGVRSLTEEIPGSLRRTLAGLIALPIGNTGIRQQLAGPEAEDLMPASSRIHSN
jgi:hypothetical protein